MFKADLRVETDVMDAVRDALRKAPGLMTTAYKRTVRRLSSRLLAELRQEPGPPHYPLRWKSRRQRRAVMAKLRRAGNLPYQRTHDLVNDWKAELQEAGAGAAVLIVENENPAFEYVLGDSQQPFHLDTGWQSPAPALLRFEEDLQDALIETWFTVAFPEILR